MTEIIDLLKPYCVPWLIEKMAPGPGDILIKSADANSPSQIVNSIILFN
tara:strand:+ start:49 stop:195 length:147 start_codon:yes stop_codon:yes gene_type:complete